MSAIFRNIALFDVNFPPVLPLCTKCAQLLLCNYHFSNGGRHLDSWYCCKYYANSMDAVAAGHQRPIDSLVACAMQCTMTNEKS